MGQVWALLFSLPVSVSHLLARPTGDASPSNPGRSVCAFTSASILILISSAAFSSSLSLRFFAPLPARTPVGPSFLPYYFSAFFSRRIERLLRRVARYAGRTSSLSFWPGVNGRRRQRVTLASGAHRISPRNLERPLFRGLFISSKLDAAFLMLAIALRPYLFRSRKVNAPRVIYIRAGVSVWRIYHRFGSGTHGC